MDLTKVLADSWAKIVYFDVLWFITLVFTLLVGKIILITYFFLTVLLLPPIYFAVRLAKTFCCPRRHFCCHESHWKRLDELLEAYCEKIMVELSLIGLVIMNCVLAITHPSLFWDSQMYSW